MCNSASPFSLSSDVVLRLCDLSSPRKLLAYEEVADCSVRLFVGQVMGGGVNPHQPPPEYATAFIIHDRAIARVHPVHLMNVEERRQAAANTQT